MSQERTAKKIHCSTPIGRRPRGRPRTRWRDYVKDFSWSRLGIPAEYLLAFQQIFSDKAWVYKRHFVQDCNGCSVAQWLGAERVKGRAGLVLGSTLSAASLLACNQQSGPSR